MKCSNCGQIIVQKPANYCNNCGHKLSTQAGNTQDAENEPKPLMDDVEARGDKSNTGKNHAPVENKQPSKLQVGEESIRNTKKKKRKRKKTKKKKDGKNSSEQDQSISDQSWLYVGEKGDKEDSSDSDQSEFYESLETQSMSLKLDQTAASSGNAQDTQQNKSPAKAEQSVPDPKDGNDATEMNDNQSADQLEQLGVDVAGSQPGSKKDTKTAIHEDQKTGQKNMNEEDSVSDKQPAQDPNGNTEPNANQTEGTQQLESKDSSLGSSQKVATTKDGQDIQQQKTATKAGKSSKPQSEKGVSDLQDGNETTESKKNQQEQLGDNGSDSQPGSKNDTKTANRKDQKTGEKKMNKKGPVSDKQPAQDPNGNTEPNANQTEGTQQLESKDSSLGSSQKVATTKDGQDIQQQKTATKAGKSSKPQSEKGVSDLKDGNETTESKKNQQEQLGDNGSDSQPGSKNDMKTANRKDQKTDEKNMNKKGPVSDGKPAQDPNGNAVTNANQAPTTKQKEKGQQKQQQKPEPSEPAGQKGVPGSSTSTMADNEGSSVDPPVESEQHPSSAQDKACGDDKERKDTANEKQKLDKQTDPSQDMNTDISGEDQLTIYFHAILSKHFKFDLEKDQIFIRVGNWKENAAEVFVQKDLGDHGYLVEGSLQLRKSSAVSESIPYKYVVCHNGKNNFEFIYKKKESAKKVHVNRCLFVTPKYLKDNCEWHQYDDIICAQPSKLDQFKEFIWKDQQKNVIQGKEIAGNVMLETIFDLLKDWTEPNLKSFFIQLSQFFKVYSNPHVYEEKAKKWSSLEYGEQNVRSLLLEFMEKNIRKHIQDSLRAAVIVLDVCEEYKIKLKPTALKELCTSLCLPKLEKDSFVKYWEEFHRDVSLLKRLPANLVRLIETVSNDGMPHWILVVPLLHHLKGSTNDALLAEKQQNIRSWAGLQGLEVGTERDMNTQHKKDLLNVVKSQSHLLEIDPFIGRACLFLMSLDSLKDCSVNIKPELLDTLQVFIAKAPESITASNMQDVSDLLSHVQENLVNEKYRCFNQTYGSQCLANAFTLLEKMCKGVKPGSYTQNFPEIPVECVKLVALVSDFVQCNKAKDTTQGDRERWCSVVKRALELMRKWINLSFKKALLSSGFGFSPKEANNEEMKMWESIITIGFKDEDFTKEWKRTFTVDFEGKFKQESPLDQIEYYCLTIEQLSASHPYCASVIEKCALEAVAGLCKTKSEGQILERIRVSWKFGKLISTIIEKSWPRNSHGHYQEDEEVVLQHLLSWTAVKHIFHLYGADEKLISQLTQDAQNRIAIAISSFTAISDQLIRGNIKINRLRVILENRIPFLELIKIDCLSENPSYTKTDQMRRLLQCREGELEAVYHEQQLVNVVLGMCRRLEKHIEVDLTDLEEKQQIPIEDTELNEFLEVRQPGQPDPPDPYVVTLFNLTEEIRDMAENLLKLEKSFVFKMFWEKEAQQLADEENAGDPDDNPGDHWFIPDVKTPEQIYEDIFQPSFHKFNDIYTRLRDGRIRLEEVNQVFRDFKGKYSDLEKDLQTMCSVDNSTDNKWITTRVQQIQQYHELHLAVASAKVIITVKEALCLQGDFRVLETLTELSDAEFQKEELSRIDTDVMQAKLVLEDITEPRKLCLQELGLQGRFVKWVKDALEDINELKVFVDLASISAGENDMDVDRVACFHDAVLGYSSMLYELKPDSGFSAFKEVIKKLWRALENDANLPKKLRDSARHIEWLKNVKDSHGSVELSSLSLATTINHKGIYLISAQGVKKLTLDKALKLQIQEESDDIQTRCYSLEDLRELQNKLMLMSGKEDQGQNEVHHFVEVFASVQRLAVAFIALYNAGNPLFRQWEAQIVCSVHSQGPNIVMDFELIEFPTVLLEGDIVETLPELCRKVENCLECWMDFVGKQRSEHYYLNYFTAEQIVYLCERLTLQKVTHLEDQVLMMLTFIKPNCTPYDLRQIWHLLQYEMLNKQQEENTDIYLQSSVEDSPFEHVWNAYMKDMKSVLPNVLDMKSLGRLLELLADKDDSKEEDSSEEDTSDRSAGCFLSREMPIGLSTGKPNLIICPHDNVLTSCISIYMTSEDMPLPTYDEVLLCNASTSYEEVEIFLRRCLCEGYRGQKIYSLLFGDLLTYDVSSKLVAFFQSMKLLCRKDFRLIVICSSEKEHAYLPSAFSQYRLHLVPQEPLVKVQHYLQKHYTVKKNTYSAARVFKGRQCVGIISSTTAGVGKSFYIKRLFEKLKFATRRATACECIRLIEPTVDENAITQALLETLKRKAITMYHFDITSSVRKGLHEFLFKLLVLRFLMDSEGKMWKCNDQQLYVIEMLKPTVKSTADSKTVSSVFTDVFPNICCRTPKEVLMLLMKRQEDPSFLNNGDPLMDDQEFRSEAFQRPFQYLFRFHNRIDLDGFTYQGVEGSHVECLQMFLMFCGIMDPSWAELRNFAWFLNLQLKDCETSTFCDYTITGDTLRGFKTFVVDFMILMAKDFATPSLSISDQSPGRLQRDVTGIREEDLAPFLIRKKWETEPHPYIFFNDDHVSMTFIGFHLQLNSRNNVDAIDPMSGKVIRRDIMTKALYDGLQLQRVPFNIDFDQLPRGEKIERICQVLGIQWPLDPDETYELTTDNILKMLAIHMRFRCGIPVVIIGETGCGKTRLIKFMCELRRVGVATENMKLVKVHGGTTADMIYSKVMEAENIATINKQDYGFDSVLFFDEANTTEAISSIKEVLCDKMVKGKHLKVNSGLQIIAACNPYRRHTDKMIERLECAGLGYRVRAEETDDKLGSIPLRQLVYRVQSLPPSMIPLVWDFGQLSDHTEKMYIQQIVQRVVKQQQIDHGYIQVITEVLSASQKYLRARTDECSFVSLRDVERCMQAFVWFYENHAMFLVELQKFRRSQTDETADTFHRDSVATNAVFWSLIMATAVCYQACLEKKNKYRQVICKLLPQQYSAQRAAREISNMQDLLLSGVPMGDTIARNYALKENVFMMVLCIELKIPLFLVGKPGSSKSLSKTLVADAMQGQAAHFDLYKKLKQIHLVSFQCSPHSTPEGIINTFKQCGRFQEGKNLNEYISVVVLDEIGLAEDSPKMPLKTLHPLLEEGCIDDEPQPHKKVGFIGISNWALDPAKMNRGIFVSRGDPDKEELIESAEGICASDPMVLDRVRDFFQPFAESYLRICRKTGKGFFGLRDYYSLIKMIFSMAKASQRKPTAEEIAKAVLRNFSGKDHVDAVKIFTCKWQITPNLESISALEFVRENLQSVGQEEECRYLLVLTKNFAALQILQQTLFSENDRPEIIFGSSFPKDQEYTQICCNINRVKICMETGHTVILLNLQNLYESLYDALNQYYVSFGGQKYVDLGLGTHRVKCRVHPNFRLIVIEEREVVYKQFPIPLINRLEKHYLDTHTVLGPEQKGMVTELETWVEHFVSLQGGHAGLVKSYKYQPADVFIGYHADTCASLILQVTEKQEDASEMEEARRRMLDGARRLLLKCATPDSVVRLGCTRLSKVETENLKRIYFEELNNSCLADHILADTRKEVSCRSFFTEVTTFSRLLTAFDVELLEQVLQSVQLFSLQQFDTELSFLKAIRTFLTDKRRADDSESYNKILIIQCDFDDGHHSANLIASAKYSSINEINKITQENEGCNTFVYFITRLPRIEGGTSYIGFCGGPWRSAHIDDLRQSKEISDVKTLQEMTISQIFETDMNQTEAMEVNDIYNDNESQEGPLEENGHVNALDTTALLQSCVQSAVSMLRDQVDTGHRSTQRVEILLTLMSDNSPIQGKFLQVVKRHLHTMLRTFATFAPSRSNWVLNEASNIEALQEGGTFMQTLWRRVQALVIPLLAHLVSVIDRDQNLNLLLDETCDDSIKNLWLDIFGDDKLLEISQHAQNHPNSGTRTILVQSYINQNINISCTMPFSWRIRDYLEELWVHALHREGQTQQEFNELFLKTPLGRYIAKADPEMQAEFFQRYLQDFIAMTMSTSHKEDLEVLSSALNCCVNELRMNLKDTKTVASIPWVHAAYHEFKNRLQNLSRMISFEPKVTCYLLRNPHTRDGNELVLDVYAALACVEHLDPRFLDTDGQRQTWLRQVKKLQVPIELAFSENSARRYGERGKVLASRVQAGWNRIFVLSLFVEHLLFRIEGLNKELSPLVLENARKLDQILEKHPDLKTQQSFETVIDLLKSCKEKAAQCIFRFGLAPCPVCMGEPQDALALPCEHIYCVACIKMWLSLGQMFCPLCLQPVADDFPLVPSENIRTLITQHAQFRKQCNAFFIDLVSSLCFKDNSPPCSEIIFHLISFVMLETNTVPLIAGDRKIFTKVLSPFDDCPDKNPVVRSVVLKLLLKYSFEAVKRYLQQHLAAVEESNLLEDKDKTELYSLYINCLEDSMFERSQFSSTAEEQRYFQDESGFLRRFLKLQSRFSENVTVVYLQEVARVRMDLDVAARVIAEKDTASMEGSQSGTINFLTSVKNLCKHCGNDWYRVYLIRKICRKHGVDFVLKLAKESELHWLFPNEVLQKLTHNEDTIHVDHYLVCGENYKRIRDAVVKGVFEGKMGKLDEACEDCKCPPQRKAVYFLLALHREVTTLYRDAALQPKPEVLDALMKYIQTSKILASAEVKAFARLLVTNQLGHLVIAPGVSGDRSVLVDLAVHLAAVLLCEKQPFLAPLQQLAMEPVNMQAAFLPSMPEDMLAVARQALGGHLRWYKCRNGHPCTIGECGQPMQKSRCVDCGAEIGGDSHTPVAGFQAFQQHGDQTKSGHVLGDPQRRDSPDMSDTKNISPVPFTIIRMLTHLAMLLGFCNRPQAIAAIIKPPVNDTGAFLHAHLRKDIECLIRCLGKGTDDTISAVHLLINSLLEPPPQMRWPAPYDNVLSTKEARNGWETKISTAIIAPFLKQLERQLKEANTIIRADSRISSNPIMMLNFANPSLLLSTLPPKSLIHSNTVWSCRDKVSLQTLAHIVEQNDGKDTLPVLWRFLEKEPEIRLVKNLPDILTLQRDLVKRFQNVSELNIGTISEFLSSQRTVSQKSWYEQRIELFLKTWNQLRVSLATNGEIRIPDEFSQSDLTLSSDFKVLLPRRQGPGLCSTALISYLIALHNGMVYCVDKNTGEDTSYKVSPADLTDLHVIHYELERDLMPLILANTQYSMERGQETVHEYDLPKIQQQLISHFLLGKPLITLNGIPTLVNRQDRNYEMILRDVNVKIKQEALQTLILFEVTAELNSYSEVCEALSTLEVALGFLAMTGGDPQMQLSTYLEEVLQMGKQMAQHILKVLSMCCLKHCVAMWQLLASLKSQNLLRLKRDPFPVPECYKKPLGEDERRWLTGFFSRNSTPTLIHEMHEFLVLFLKAPDAPDTYRPDWGLKDTLVSYLEKKDMDVPPEVELLFPTELTLAHYVESWKFIVEMKQDRRPRL